MNTRQDLQGICSDDKAEAKPMLSHAACAHSQKVVSFSRGYRQAGMYWLADVYRRTPQLPGYGHTAWGEDEYFFAPEGYWALKLLDRVQFFD